MQTDYKHQLEQKFTVKNLEDAMRKTNFEKARGIDGFDERRFKKMNL